MRIIIILAVVCCVLGCAEVPVKPVTTEPVPVMTESEVDYQSAAGLMKEHKFNEAIALYRKIMAEAPGTKLESDAQYQIALAHALNDNPDKNYTTAIKEFEDFIRLRPADDRVVEAQNWISTIRLYLDLKKQNESLRKENEQLHKNIEELKRLDIQHEERRKNK